MNSGSKVLGQLELEIWVGVEPGTAEEDKDGAETQVIVSIKNPVGSFKVMDVVTIPESLDGDPLGDVLEVKIIALAKHLLYDAAYGLTVTDFVPVSQLVDPCGALRRYQVTVRGGEACAGYFIRQVGGGHRLEGYGWVPGQFGSASW